MNSKNRNFMSLACELDNDNERDVYTLIAVYYMFENKYPSKVTIARITGLSAFSVDRAILGLKDIKRIDDEYKAELLKEQP